LSKGAAHGSEIWKHILPVHSAEVAHHSRRLGRVYVCLKSQIAPFRQYRAESLDMEPIVFGDFLHFFRNNYNDFGFVPNLRGDLQQRYKVARGGSKAYYSYARVRHPETSIVTPAE
jgi:hypothetical protein